MGELQRIPKLPQRAVTQELADVAVRNKVTLVRAGVAAAGVGVLAVSAPFVWMAASAGMGLLALGVVAVVGFGLIQALPLIGQKWENKLLAMRKQEARDNPEEQLDNRLICKKENQKKAKGALGIILGYVRGLERMIADEKQNDPGHDISHLEKSLDAMRKFVAKKVGDLKRAEEKLAEFEKAVKRWKFEHRFAERGKVAIDSINAMEGGDATEELLTQEAIMSIEEGYDALFGAVDLEGLLAQAADLQKKSPELIETDDNVLTVEASEVGGVNGRRR